MSMNKEFQMLPMLQPNKLQVTEYHDHVRYDYYLMGDIGSPEEYIDVCHALRSCGPQDVFFLRINSGGGQVRTGNMLINALQECQGVTVGFIESECGSMATFCFLACDEWGVSKYAEWFSHTVSSGNYGKESETFEAAQFLRKQTHSRIREDYKAFLTDEEIESVLRGSDIYLDADEILERLETYAEYRESLPCDRAQDQPASLEELIENMIDKKLGNSSKAMVDES